MIHTPRVGALIFHLNFSPRAIYASRVSERSEASNVSERSEVPSVTGDFLWGYFFYLAPPHFFYRGAVDFFTPHIFFF